MSIILEVDNVSINYGDIKAISDVSLNVEDGEIFSIIGSNGMGKTTLLKGISHIIPVKHGNIIFRNKRINGLSPHQIVNLGLAQIPEGRAIFGSQTVLENLEMGGYTVKSKEKKKVTFDKVFNFFPRLYQRRNQLAETLSGGEQQMLAIGRGLMCIPRLLIFDEPSQGLGPLIVKEIFEIIKKINIEGTTVLLVEQNVMKALKISDSCCVLKNGKVVLQGSGDELLKNQEIREIYLGL